ncbi:hypothetical protein LELG_02911 [Lodderomyces elongisporus NRRL YB-4239]|uniref:Uncharacterized protein n=1 Tax=Lodderomyces elongisporus (strain ATCC 11503 / CBS 2605 / JCM 1781 / NBRC 1676 / NRRL YB-4239) TaxID=379508 RepID=A5DZX4_LODEL|nr:hypothetical protein LELG_02911 [Lodderomyces elongisporus NRRL YB-4239]
MRGIARPQQSKSKAAQVMEVEVIPKSTVTSNSRENTHHERLPTEVMQSNSHIMSDSIDEVIKPGPIMIDDVPVYLVHAANAQSAKKVVKDWTAKKAHLPSSRKDAHNKLKADKVKQQLNAAVRQRQEMERVERESAPSPVTEQSMQESRRELDTESPPIGEQSPPYDSHLPFLELQFPDENIDVDPDYEYEEPSSAGIRFEPSALTMDRELENLAMEDTVDPDEELKLFLSEGKGIEQTSTPQENGNMMSHPQEEVPKVKSDVVVNEPLNEEQANATADDGVDSPVADDSIKLFSVEDILRENQLDELAKLSATSDQPHHLADDSTDPQRKSQRRVRTSKLTILDKQAAFKDAMKHNFFVFMDLSKYLGMHDDARAMMRESTKAMLVDRDVLQKALKDGIAKFKKKPVVTEVNLTTTSTGYHQPGVTQELLCFPASIHGRRIEMKYDTAAQLSLINPQTLKGLPIKPFPLSQPVFVQGVNNDTKAITQGVFLDVTVHFISLPAILYLHEQIPVGQVLLGLPFQDAHKLSIGFTDDGDKRELRFRANGNIHKFPIRYDGDSNYHIDSFPTVQVSQTVVIPPLSEMLRPAFTGSRASEDDIRYFVDQCAEVSDVFYIKGGDPGRLKPEIHPPVRINLRDPNVHWRMKSIPLGSKRTAAVEILQEMIRQGQLVYSDATYRNPWFLISKKDGRHRLLIDLRELNKNVELEGGHPLSVDDLTTEISGCWFISTIDVQNAYFQIPLDAATSDVTSFNSPLGLLKYAVLPQGYINSVSEFSSILQKILSPVAKDVMCFIDDIAIVGPKVDELTDSLVREHLDKIVEVFRLLTNAGLKINPAKLKIAVPECDFLGYHISPAGKTLIRGQVDALLNYPLPNTVKQLESFLGLVNYYRQLIVGHAELTAPLYNLVNQARKEPKHQIHWDPTTKRFFHQIITVLTNQPILQPLNFKDLITVHTDASTDSWGGVLQNTNAAGESKLVLCYSGKFHGSEKNYTIYEKELFSIYKTFDAIHPLLFGFTGVIHLYCDNKALVLVMNKPLDNSHFVNRVYKWLNFIRTFNYQIHHIDGLKNIIADALSRCHTSTPQTDHYEVREAIAEFRAKLDPKVLAEVNVVTIEAEPNNSYKKIPLQALRKYLEARTIPVSHNAPADARRFINRALEFYLHDGILYKLGRTGSYTRRVVYENNQVEHIFNLAHRDRGHPGVETTFNLINTGFYIPNLYRRLADYIKRCVYCQKDQPATRQRDPLYLNYPAGMFHTIVCDCVKLRDATVVVARDEFLGWPEAQVLPKVTAEAVADFIYSNFIARVGTFSVLKTDNGREFHNEVLQQLLSNYGISPSYSVPYHPQGNGMIEASHKRLIRFIKLVPENKNLSKVLNAALWVDRTTVRKRTGFTPQYLVFGFEGNNLLQSLMQTPSDIQQYTEDELFKFRVGQFYFRKQQEDSAKETQRRDRDHQKEVFDKRYDTNVPIKKGDLVLVYDAATNKMGLNWSGPFVVRKVLSRIYYLSNLQGIPMKRQYTREMLKPFVAAPLSTTK